MSKRSVSWIWLGCLCLGMVFSACSPEISVSDPKQNLLDSNETDTEWEGFHAFSPENTYMFDLNTDSIVDTFYVVPPALLGEDETIQDCEGPCITKIFFGNLFPPLSIPVSMGGEVVVLEDVNENGFRELVFFPYWFQSCWSRMDIFSFTGEEWILVKSIDYNNCYETTPTRFEKLGKGQLRVFTNGSQYEEYTNEKGEKSEYLSGVEAKVYDVQID
jgi:hypothetical protein